MIMFKRKEIVSLCALLIWTVVAGTLKADAVTNTITLRDKINLAGSWENRAAGPNKYGNWRVQPALRPDVPPTNQWVVTYLPGHVVGHYYDPSANKWKLTWKVWTKEWNGFVSNDCWNVWAERDVDIPAAWQGRRVFFGVDTVLMDAIVYVNDSRMGEILNPDGEIDVTSGLKFGERNRLRLFITGDYTGISRGAKEDRIRSICWGKEKGPLGIGGKIGLQSFPAWGRITDVFVKTSWRKKKLYADVEVDSVQPLADVTVRGAVIDSEGRPALQLTSAPLSFPAGRSVQKLEADWANPRVWEPGDTNLYTLAVSVSNADGKTADEYPAVRFGFREIWVQGKDMYLNGHIFRWRMHYPGHSLQGTAFYLGMGYNVIYCVSAGHWTWYEDHGGESVGTGEAFGCAVTCPIPGVKAFVKELSEDAELQKQWNVVLERYIRRYRNSPYILAWGVTTLASGLNMDYFFPPGLGKRAPANSDKTAEWGCANVELASDMVRRLDPTRLVFSHDACGGTGDMHTYFWHLNWIPLQELEEWLSEWSKSGEVPIGSGECGVSIWSGDFYRKGDGTAVNAGAWAPPNGDPMFTEYCAMRLGDRAYELETDDEVRDLIKLTRLNNKVRDPSETRFDPTPAVWEVLEESGLRLGRAWRVWGLNGGWLPWTFVHGYGGKPDQKEDAHRYGYGNLPGKPEDYLRRPEWANGLYDAYRSCQRPLLAYIAGPAKTFTVKDHVYYGNEKIEKSVALVWDSGKPIEARVCWDIDCGGKRIDGFDKTVKLAPGEIRFESISFRAPKVKNREELTISCRVTAPGEDEQKDTFRAAVYPPAQKVARADVKIGLYDPTGLTGKALAQLGISVQAVSGGKDLGGCSTLIIGSRSLKPAQPLPFSAEDVARGLRVVIFEHSYDVLESFGFRTAEVFARKMFAREPGSPLLSGIESDDLRDWRGAPTLLPDRGFIRKYPEPHGYHWGNNGVVASVLIETPHLGSFTPVVNGEFDMQYSPLLQWRHGKGAVTFCQLDVTGRIGTDPVAARIFMNLVNQGTAQSDAPCCPVELLSDSRLLPFFTSLQFDLKSVTSPSLKSGTALVIGGGGGAALEKCKPELLQFVEQGGTVFVVLGKEEELNKWLPVRIKCERKELARCSRKMINEDFLCGVGPSLLRWRAMIPVETIAAEGLPAQARRLADGCFVVLPYGKGRIILSRLDPLAFDLPETTDRLERNIVRGSAWHMRCLYSQLLGNLGADSSIELAGSITHPRAVKGLEQFVDLQDWQVLGPFDEGNEKNNGNEKGPNFDKVLLPETRVDLNGEVKDGGRALRWTKCEMSRAGANQLFDKPFQGPDGWVDCTAHRTVPKKPGVVSYACATFKSPRPGTVEFRAGVDWWLKVWVNGKPAYSTSDFGGPKTKNGAPFKADVQEGTNTVLVKVAAGSNGYGFWLTMLAPDAVTNEIPPCSYYTEPLRPNDDPYIYCGW